MSHFNVAIAIRYTPYFARKAGWTAHLDKVCIVLGFHNHYPTAKQFVIAVQKWQGRHRRLRADGILGPLTWARLKPLVDANPDKANFVGPHPAWVSSVNADVYPQAPKSTPVPVVTVRVPSKEDLVIQEMIRVSLQTKDNHYLAVAVSKEYVAADGYPAGARSDFTGKPISQTLSVGQKWESIAGSRIIIGLSGGGSWGRVLFVTDSGQAYVQHIEGWESDLFAKHWASVSDSLKPIKFLLEVEAAFLVGMCAATSVAAGAFFLTSSVTQWMLQNKDKIPKYIYAVGALLEIRSRLKAIAPTLYSKVVDVALRQVLSEIPDAFADSPDKIARFVGGLVVKLGKIIFLRDFKSVLSWLGVVSEIIFGAVRVVPKAGAKAVTDADFVESLKRAGADITLGDAEVIRDEVQRQLPEVMKLFQKVQDLTSVFQE